MVQILDLWPTLALWRSVYFIGHVLMVGVVILGMVSPPRRPRAKAAPSSSKEDQAVEALKNIDSHAMPLPESAKAK